jgi:hypothetical protein
MSNSYFINPILLDTFTSDIDVGNEICGMTDIPFYVEHIEWQKPTNTTHHAVITDSYGATVFDEQCTVANQSVFKPFGGMIIMGLKVASGAVDSGKISIKLS